MSQPQAMHEDTDQHHAEDATHIVALPHEPTHDTLAYVARNRPSVLGQRGALLMPRRVSGGAFDFHGTQHVVGAPIGATNMAGKRKDRYAAMMDHETNHANDNGEDDDDDDDDDNDGDDDVNNNNNNVGVTTAVVADTRVSGELTQQLKRFRFASTTFSITVRTLTGKQLLLSVHSSDTVDDLKARIEELEGIPVAQQRLVFGGRVLPDVDSLHTHNITDEGAELHLVLALRGGVCCASPHCLCVANVAIDDFFTSLPRRSHK